MQLVFHEAIFDKKCAVRESSISMYEEANQLDIYFFRWRETPNTKNNNFTHTTNMHLSAGSLLLLSAYNIQSIDKIYNDVHICQYTLELLL